MTRQHWTVALLVGLPLAGCQASPTSGPSKPPEQVALGPLVEIKDKVIHTAIEDTAKTYDYTFTVTNAGDQPLELKLTKKSCWCTEVEVPREPILPGQSGNVVFHWSPTPVTPSAYTSAAELQTNDSKMPLLRLELRASVSPLIRLSTQLPYLDFGTLSPNATGEIPLKVFSTKLQDFELDASASPALAILKEKLPEGDVVEDARALSGYRLLLKTTDKLPPNYFRDDLVLTVKVANQEPRKFTLPIYAMRENGAFTIVPTQVEFHKDRITDEDSKKVLVKFLAPSENDRVEVVRVDPSFLTTTAPVKDEQGAWRFEVKLPRDNADAAKYQPDSFMEGHILLKLSGTEVALRVKWAPESK